MANMVFLAKTLKSFAYIFCFYFFLLAMRETGVNWIEAIVSSIYFNLFFAILSVVNLFTQVSFAKQALNKKEVVNIIKQDRYEFERDKKIEERAKF